MELGTSISITFSAGAFQTKLFYLNPWWLLVARNSQLGRYLVYPGRSLRNLQKQRKSRCKALANHTCLGRLGMHLELHRPWSCGWGSIAPWLWNWQDKQNHSVRSMECACQLEKIADTTVQHMTALLLVTRTHSFLPTRVQISPFHQMDSQNVCAGSFVAVLGYCLFRPQYVDWSKHSLAHFCSTTGCDHPARVCLNGLGTLQKLRLLEI